MKGLICIYSSTGNTRLACEYLASKLNMEFDFYDIIEDWAFDIDNYDIIGFATYSNYMGLSEVFSNFIENLPEQNRKPAFVFNTYGMISGWCLKLMQSKAESKGFKILGGHSLHTPENHPPMIAQGKTYEDSPDEQELREFEEFIARLQKNINQNREEGVKLGIPDLLVPALPRFLAQFLLKKEMGSLRLNRKKCIECGLCEKICPYDAISLEPKPVFEENKCRRCWACFNRCPEKAIHTTKQNKGRYPEPHQKFKDKLS